MVFGDISSLCEIEIVKPVCHEEHAVNNIFYLEIRPCQFIVEIILFLLYLFGVVPPVPGLKFKLPAFLVYYLLLGRDFGFGNRKGRFPYLYKEIKNPFGSFCHVPLESKISIASVAEQISPVEPEPRDPGNNLLIVVSIVIITLHEVRRENLLPQFPVFRVFQEGFHYRILDSECPFSFLIHLFGSRGGLGYNAFGKPCQILFLVDEQCEVVGLSKKILTEFYSQERHLFIYLPQFVLVGGRQFGATPYKSLVGVVEDFLFLVGQIEFVHILKHRFNPEEKGIVEVDVIPVLGEQGSHFHVDCLKRIVGVGRVESPEYTAYLREQRSAVFKLLYRVFESSLLFACHYLPYYSLLFFKGFQVRGLVMFRPYLFKGRNAKGCFKFIQKRIVAFFLPVT